MVKKLSEPRPRPKKISRRKMRAAEILISNVRLGRSKPVAPPTQGIWRSNDYVSAVRLVECKLLFFFSI